MSTWEFYEFLHAAETARQRRPAKIISRAQAGSGGGDALGEAGPLGDGPAGAESVPAAGVYKTTTEPDPNATGQPADLVGRDFTADQPGVKLVGDITDSAQSLVMCCSAG